MVAVFAPKFVRTYETNVPATFGASTQGSNVPAGTPQCNSVKPDLTVLGDSSNTGYTALRNTLRTYFAGMPDIPKQRAACHHEPEGDPGFTPAQYAQAQVNFQNDVINYVNLSRTNPITAIAILQAYTLTAGSGRDITTWFTPAVLSTIAEIGFDVYTAAEIGLAGAYVAANGNIPWAVPEYGYSVSTVGTDAQQKAFMTANTPGFKTMAQPPTFVAYFNGVTTGLNTWQSAGTSIGATSVPVAALPGTIPSGSAMVIDYGGANPEAVNTNASSSGTTVHVPALAHAHSTDAVIELFPLSCAQWRAYCA
jgi:hypothetical protein